MSTLHAQTIQLTGLTNGNTSINTYQNISSTYNLLSYSNIDPKIQPAPSFIYYAEVAKGKKDSSAAVGYLSLGQNNDGLFSIPSEIDKNGLSYLISNNSQGPVGAITASIPNEPFKWSQIPANGLSLIQSTTPTYSDYVNLPKDKYGEFEFHDHEATTLSGTTVGLSTTILSATYLGSLPSSNVNGAEVIQHAIYQEELIGSGNIAWMVTTAPTDNKYASIDLNTFANMTSQNYNGAISINVPNGNSFQMATNEDSGTIGWTHIGSGTKLTLSADLIYTPGSLVTAGTIITDQGLNIGNIASSSVNISPNFMTFSNNNGVSTITGLDVNGNFSGAFLLQSSNPGGILLNSIGDYASITLAVNSVIVAKVTNKGFRALQLTDDQILNIADPEPGDFVYSKDHSTLAVYNGSGWTYSGCQVKIERH